jgi:hypothetical protein
MELGGQIIPRSLYSQGKRAPTSNGQEAGWPSEPVWTRWQWPGIEHWLSNPSPSHYTGWTILTYIVELSLYVIKYHVTKTNGHTFLNSTPEGHERSTSLPGHFTPSGRKLNYYMRSRLKMKRQEIGKTPKSLHAINESIKVGTLPRHYKTSQPRRTPPETSPPWKPQKLADESIKFPIQLYWLRVWINRWVVC